MFVWNTLISSYSLNFCDAINFTVIRELSTIIFFREPISGDLYMGAYIRGIITGGFISMGLQPGAYTRGHISRGLITGSLYPGAYIRGLIFGGL